MAKINAYMPDGTIAAAAALRVLRQVPAAMLMLSVGEYYVVPGGRIAKPKARALIRQHLTTESLGLFSGCAQSWVHPCNGKPVAKFKTLNGYLRAEGEKIARRQEAAAAARQPYSAVDAQRRTINVVLARHNVARIADSEAPTDTLVRMYQALSPRDDDHRRLLAACLKWAIGPMGRRPKTPKETQHGIARENETAKGDAADGE